MRCPAGTPNISSAVTLVIGNTRPPPIIQRRAMRRSWAGVRSTLRGLKAYSQTTVTPISTMVAKPSITHQINRTSRAAGPAGSKIDLSPVQPATLSSRLSPSQQAA